MRSDFNISNDFYYLNSGTHSIVPNSVMQALHQYQQEYETNPTRGLMLAWGKLWEAQKSIAEYINANPKNIFLRVNITEALNEFILQFPMPSGSEILVSNQEYGAVVNICRSKCLSDSLILKKFSLPNKNEIKKSTVESILDRITESITPLTKMIVLSEISSSSGVVLPIKEIAKETRKREIYLIVDGAHSPGFLNLNFDDYQNVDAYAGNLHKWFMGPKGTAFGWIHDMHKDKIPHALQSGWSTFEKLETFEAFAEGDAFATKMLMVGCRDFSNFYALKDTCEFWKRIGKDKIFDRIRKLDKFLIQTTDKELKIFRFASQDPRLTGPLHPYLLPEKFQSDKHATLMSKFLTEAHTQVNITLINNEKYLRLSPHVYNTENEITDSVSRLARLINS